METSPNTLQKYPVCHNFHKNYYVMFTHFWSSPRSLEIGRNIPQNTHFVMYPRKVYTLYWTVLGSFWLFLGSSRPPENGKNTPKYNVYKCVDRDCFNSKTPQKHLNFSYIIKNFLRHTTCNFTCVTSQFYMHIFGTQFCTTSDTSLGNNFAKVVSKCMVAHRTPKWLHLLDPEKILKR